jgi:hypothetical protein
VEGRELGFNQKCNKIMELELIKNSILEIRGKRVILDYELAKLYDIETKRPQQFIEVTYNKIKIPTAKYPVKFFYLTKKIIILFSK